jgi:hypothetical protein
VVDRRERIVAAQQIVACSGEITVRFQDGTNHIARLLGEDNVTDWR